MMSGAANWFSISTLLKAETALKAQNEDLARMALPGPRPASLRDCGFEIDDERAGLRVVDHRQEFAPDIRRGHVPGDETRFGFCEFEIAGRCRCPGLVDRRVTGVCLDLVDSAPEHHVSCEEQSDAVTHRVSGRRHGFILAGHALPGCPR